MARELSTLFNKVETTLLSTAAVLNDQLPENYETYYATRSNFIIQSDTFAELGGVDRSAFALTYRVEKNFDDEVLLIGDELRQELESQYFGLLATVAGEDLNEELFYIVLQNFKRLLQIKGLMVKGNGQEIWLRVSKEAANNGLTFAKAGKILIDRLHREFPEIKAVRLIFIHGKSSFFNALQEFASAWNEQQEALKEKIWESRGFKFKECHVLGHCGKCSDRKLCSNVRKIERIMESNHLNKGIEKE